MTTMIRLALIATFAAGPVLAQPGTVNLAAGRLAT